MNLFVLLYLLIFPAAPSEELVQIRADFHQAISEQNLANELNQKLQGIANKSNLQLGYAGATQMLLAKFAFLPNQKYQLFSEGKSKLENAIRQDRKNPELIYLRYIIQTKCPAFLGYNQDLSRDKNYLLQVVKAIEDKDLQKRILVFLIVNAQLTTDERRLLG